MTTKAEIIELPSDEEKAVRLFDAGWFFRGKRIFLESSGNVNDDMYCKMRFADMSEKFGFSING